MTLAITCGPVGLAQGVSGTAQIISKYNEKIATSYDDVKAITTVRLNSMQLYGESLDSSKYAGGDEASFQASFSYTGRILKAEPKRILFSLTSTSEDWKYTDFRKLTVLVDGKRFNLGPLAHVPTFTVNASKNETSDDYILQRIVIYLPYKSFLRIANGKKVQIRMGPREFELVGMHLEALRDFAARMIHSRSISLCSLPFDGTSHEPSTLCVAAQTTSLLSCSILLNRSSARPLDTRAGEDSHKGE